ncbi:MAG: phosphoribosyltransferase [Halolamina sp.]
MFTDRTDAGRQLAARLEEQDVRADLVLAIPRGGLPVGRVVADSLGVPLDVVAARKIGAPGNPELAIGAVGSDGGVWLNEALIGVLGVDEATLEERIDHERASARATVERYRGDRTPLDLDGKRVVLVDDGAATGATTIACLRQLGDAGVAAVVVAVPVAPAGTIEKLEREADAVICVETPGRFQAVGQFYDDFEQVSDEQATAYLATEER